MEDYLRSYTTRFFKNTDIFPVDSIKKCNNNVNEAPFLPLEVKNDINLMAMEQELYSQVVVIRREDLKFTEANKNKMKLNSSSKFSLKYHRVGLILVFIVLN